MTTNAQNDRQADVRDWYRRYRSRLSGDRNDLRSNPGVLFQAIALEVSVVRAVGRLTLATDTALALDVGCGGGGDIFHLLRLGFRPENIVGIDILPERLERAKRLYPNIGFVHGDATRLPFPDGHFDVMFESTMFATLPDQQVCEGIASEMLRVCKPGAHIVLADWRTPHPRRTDYRALTRRRLAALFGLGRSSRLVVTTRGALIPPLGRFLSARAPSLYFLIAGWCPFLVGQVTYVLEKTDAAH